MTPSTISERTEPDSPPLADDAQPTTRDDDESEQPRQRCHEGMFKRLVVAPLRRLLARCLGRDAEDVPQ